MPAAEQRLGDIMAGKISYEYIAYLKEQGLFKLDLPRVFEALDAAESRLRDTPKEILISWFPWVN